MSSSFYHPISLSRLLSELRHAKGLPPSSLLSSGVACLCPQSMQRDNYEVLSILRINSASTKKMVFVRAWPLEGVGEGFVSLDDGSLCHLGLDRDKLAVMPSPMSPRTNKRKAKKKSTPRRKDASQARADCGGGQRNGFREQQTVHSNSNGMREDASTYLHPSQSITPILHVSRCETAKPAERVSFTSETSFDFLFSDEFASMVADELVGRVLIPGSTFTTTALGEPLNLVVNSIMPSGSNKNEVFPSPVSFERHSKLDISSPQNDSPNRPSELGSTMIIGGLDSQMAELKRLVLSSLQQAGPTHFIDSYNLNQRQSRRRRVIGALLHGHSGTGKTLLASAIAADCSVHLEVLCGPELRGNLFGEGTLSIKAGFAKARARKPSIVLLDEVDAIAPRRDAPNTDESQRKLIGALLAILDDPDDSSLDGLFVIGTTSRPDAIDPALRRPGRIEEDIEIPIPNSDARLEILKALTRIAVVSQRLDVDERGLGKIAATCYGYVGADLAALWRESVGAALQRDSIPSVCFTDFRLAMKKVCPSGLREVAVEIPFTKWDDIGGMRNAKHRLQEAVEWPLTRTGASLFSSIGITPPAGILLYGPPGCSKTLLARAVATESGANFISVKGAELLSKWVGESEKAVRNVFRRARQAAPCVIFFDEIDALASSRSSAAGASAQARVVAQLLAEMDGVDSPSLSGRVVIIAATNRPDRLDSAFLRPGRIDVQIYVGLPDDEERLSILKVHTRKTPLAEDVDLDSLAGANSTGGFSGAELAALVREAALRAMEKDITGASFVCMDDFKMALRQMKPRTPVELVKFFDRYSSALEDKG